MPKIQPSTSGMMVAEWRDLMVATNSEVLPIARSCTACTLTGARGGPWGASALVRPQALSTRANARPHTVNNPNLYAFAREASVGALGRLIRIRLGWNSQRS